MRTSNCLSYLGLCSYGSALSEWFQVLGSLILSSVLEVVVGRLRRGILLLLILRRFLQALLIPMFTFSVADVIKSFDKVDRDYS